MSARIGCGSVRDRTKADEPHTIAVAFTDGTDDLYTVMASGAREARTLAKDIARDEGKKVRTVTLTGHRRPNA